MVLMNKIFCFVIIFILLFSLNGCSENSNTAIDTATTDESNTQDKAELSNPGEYLADLCSGIKIGDVEFSLPCSYEDMSKVFSLVPIEFDDRKPYNEFTPLDYGVFSSDNEYFGIATFADYGNKNELWLMYNDHRKSNISYFDNDIQNSHQNDEVVFSVGDFVSNKTKRNEIIDKLGVGYVSQPLINEGDYYDFEDGTLVILYEGDTAIEFHISFYR